MDRYFYKKGLGAALLDEIKEILVKDGDQLEEDLGQIEFFTDKDGVSYMLHKDDGSYLQDFSCSAEIVALVDAFNVITTGKVQRITWQEK